jgi:hypothetical protein
MADYSKDEQSSGRSEQFLAVFNKLIIGLALLVLAGIMIYFLIGSFLISFSSGLRSLMAIFLPFIFIIYITFFSKVSKGKTKTPPFNTYFIFTVWTIMMLILADYFYDVSLPLGELLAACTLAAVIWNYKRSETKGLISCSYGVVTGCFIYAIAGLANVT